METVQIGIADDHRLFREGIVRIIDEFEGMEVKWEAKDGMDLLKRLQVRKALPDLLLMDHKIPGMPAVEAIPKIRKRFGDEDLKILVLSNFDDDAYILKCIKAGANGYLFKSVFPNELEHAIHTTLKFGHYFTPRVNKLLLDEPNDEPVKDPKTEPHIQFNERELDILKLICEEKMTKEIADELDLSQRTVEEYRRRMMKKVGAKNVVGLVLYAVSEGLFDEPNDKPPGHNKPEPPAIGPPPLVQPPLVTHPDSQKPIEPDRPKWKYRLWAMSVVLLAIVVILNKDVLMGWLFSKPPTNTSIGVLPFENHSNDHELDYFASGITLELVNRLSRIDSLKVVDLFTKRDRVEPIQPDMYNVEWILAGTVRKLDRQMVRVDAHLTKIADGSLTGLGQFDGEWMEMIPLQERIAGKIAKKLHLEVGPSLPERVLTEDTLAFKFYLAGKYALERDTEGTRDAKSHFEKALEHDPAFADAHAGIADALLNHSAYGFMPSSAAFADARAEVIEALKLDPGNAYAHKMMAYVNLFFDWDWEEAKKSYDKACELGIKHPDIFITYYNALITRDFEQAISDAKEIVVREPESIEALWQLGLCNLLGRQYDSAISVFNETIEMDSGYSEGYRWIAASNVLLGHFDEALKYYEHSLTLTDWKGPALSGYTIALMKSGRQAEGMDWLKKISQDNIAYEVDPVLLGGVFVSLGELDEGFQWLERGYRERTLWMVTLNASPDWEPLREHPRFQTFIQRMRFPPAK